MRRVMILSIAAVLLFCGMRLLAHDQFRIIGTITRLQGSQLQVKTKDGATLSVKVDAQTYIHRDKQKVSSTELKTGRSVVVDALGDSEADLLAVEVRIVPTIASSPAKMTDKSRKHHETNVGKISFAASAVPGRET